MLLRFVFFCACLANLLAAAPIVSNVDPAPGALVDLTNITITFDQPVTGVRAADLFLGGQPASDVTGSGTTYLFSFQPPAAGPVELRWDADTLITDLETPPNRFDPLAAGTWQYQILDRTAPMIATVTPVAGATVRALTRVDIRFSEPVRGVDASDLLVNGVPATNVTGQAEGPYRFTFASPAAGGVRFSWAANAGIRDLAEPPNVLGASEWSVVLDPGFLPSTLRINEFLSSNISAAGLKDEDGELQDWIEIYNPTSTSVSLNGWSLTDDSSDPVRWPFPAISIGPKQYLVVFASGKDRRPITAGSKLHTNFKLNPAGEYLGLFGPDSANGAVSEFAPAFPEQRNDYSYGYDSAGLLKYFRTPSPAAANGGSTVAGVTPAPHVNASRGWFDDPFDLYITSPLPEVTFRYTTDGSEPTETTGIAYTGPIRIQTTATIRIVAFSVGKLPSLVQTYTYLFPNDILRQPNNPPGFPVGTTVMAGYPSDYEMDPEIVTNSAYRTKMRDAILSLPAVSIVCKRDDMFGAVNGIYTHPTTRGPSWERPCSMEFIPTDNSDGFQTAAGIQVQGNAARDPQKQPKHPLRVVFKGDYGPTRLNFPIFPDSPVTSFDTLVLRADFNFSWLHWDSHQRVRGQRTRDSWMKDSMRAMGDMASHNRYVHLFINGLYWGIYDPSERPDAAFAASYMGGQKEDYDVVNEGSAVDGGMTAYNAMLALTGLSTAAGYAQMQKYLDMPQFIDYILLHFYVGHQDWGQDKNWYTMRPKDGHTGFFYVPWDGENILDDVNYNRVTSTDTPSGLHTKLLANSEYKLAFADRVQKHLFNNGALTPAATAARWRRRASQVDLAIIAESARWGDYRRDVHQYQTPPYELYTRDNQWLTEQSRLLNDYFPKRTGIVLSQLRAAGLYPAIGAPQFSQFGGQVRAGFLLTLTSADGPIYYTLDGSDPRVAGSGAIASSATAYESPIPLTASTRVSARVLKQGVWSALSTADFQMEFQLPLRFTEIMYHPIGGDPFEFVELANTGAVDLDMSGFSLRGLEFLFPPHSTLKAGQTAVLASSLGAASSFSSRYPGVSVTGWFNGLLSNNGEKLELRDRDGRLVTSVTYADSGAWPAAADGKGFSLQSNGGGDPNDASQWWAAAATPGKVTALPVLPAVRISEVFAAPDATRSITDFIELSFNGTGTQSIDGWSLRDSQGHFFVFPPNTSIGAGSNLVLWCDIETNVAGFHSGFGLNREGDSVTLADRSGEKVDFVAFGLQAAGYSISRLGGNENLQPATTDQWRLSNPTPGTPNVEATVASSSVLKLNEWLANSAPEKDDWIELYNSDPALPASLNNLVLGTDAESFQVHLLTFLEPHGFARLWADEGTGPGHLGFKLPATGGSIVLLDPIGNSIDRITYSSQTEGISEGRVPDGALSISTLNLGGTPGQSNNPLTPTVILNEVLVAGANGVGWIELFNPTANAIDLSGFQLDTQPDNLKPWLFPAGSRLGPSEYLLVNYDASQRPSVTVSNRLDAGRGLSTIGGTIGLRDPIGHELDSLSYGFSVPGQTIGRAGGAWALLSTPTPGNANSAPAELGSVSSLRLNEWWAVAAVGGGDWLELYNRDAKPVSLTDLLISDQASIAGKRRFQVGALSFIPAHGWVQWKASNGPKPDELNFHLDAYGEHLGLYTADGLPIDLVDFGALTPSVSQGRLDDGGDQIGDLSHPTPGASNTSPAPDLDTDGDGLPDAWEKANGTNPLVADADADPDHDGFTNRQEYLAGTNPLDSGSALKFQKIAISSGSVQLDFMVASNRTYSVLFKSGDLAAPWQKLADIPSKPDNRLETISDPGVTGARYYRIVTPATVP